MKNTIKLSSPATQEFWEIPILYEDAQVLALDKPSGVPAVPDRAQPERPSLLRLLHDGIKRGAPWARAGDRSYLMATHRLDAETSGVMLLAKSKPVLIALLNHFGASQPGRRHVALVQGTPPEARFQIDTKLAPHPARAGLMCANARRGKRSVTLFEVREKFSGYTLLQCEPLTDRPHQIRAHLRVARLPVLGDQLYGGRELRLSQLKPDYRLKPNQVERPLIARAAVHCEALALPHPLTGEPLSITAPWPRQLAAAIKYLRKFAPA